MIIQERAILSAIRYGVYAILFLPIVIIPWLFFPFSTSKGFLFQIIVEIIFALYIALVLKNRSFLPQKSALFYAVSFYFLALLLSTVFGIDQYYSFFGNYERMWGFFQLLHFFLFFIIIAGIFKSREEWQKLIKVALISGALSIAVGLFQFGGPLIFSGETPRISSIIGNPAFFASYLFFILFFSFALGSQFRNQVSRYYLALAGITLFSILATATRGAFVGLGAASMSLASLVLFFYKDRIAKITSSIYLIAIVASIVLLFSYGSLFEKPEKISQEQFYALERLDAPEQSGSRFSFINRLTEFSIYDVTTQTRLITWRASLGALKDFSLFGIGPENFALAFNKYFDSEFYSYEQGEVWFDRAHNIYIDILVTNGWIGFLAYASMFAVAFYLIFSLFKKGKLNFTHLLAFSLFFTAYLFQNVVLFDSFSIFLMLMIVFAYLNSFTADYQSLNFYNSRLAGINIVNAGSLIALALTVVYFYNIRPFKESYYVAKAESGIYSIDESMKLYRKALTFRTFGDNEARSRMALSVAKEVQNKREQDALPENLTSYLDEAIAALKANIENTNQYHLLYRLQLSDLYNLKLARTESASEEIEDIVKKSIEISPGRMEFEFALSQTEFLKGDFEGAIEMLKQVSLKNPNHKIPYWKIAQNYNFMEQTGKAIPYFEKALYLGHKPQIPGEILWAEKYYVDKQDFVKLIFIDQILLGMYSQNTPEQIRLYQNIALSYAKLDKKEKAKEYALKILDIDPSQRQLVEDFISALQ